MARDINKLKDRLHAVKGLDSASAYNAQDEDERKKKQAAQLKSDAQINAARQAGEQARLAAIEKNKKILRENREANVQAQKQATAKSNANRAVSPGIEDTISRKQQLTDAMVQLRDWGSGKGDKWQSNNDFQTAYNAYENAMSWAEQSEAAGDIDTAKYMREAASYLAKWGNIAGTELTKLTDQYGSFENAEAYRNGDRSGYREYLNRDKSWKEIDSHIKGLEKTIESTSDLKRRSEYMEELDWYNNYARDNYTEAAENELDLLKRKQDTLQNALARSEINNSPLNGTPVDDSQKSETLKRFDEDIEAAKAANMDPWYISALEKARESFAADASPVSYEQNWQDIDRYDELSGRIGGLNDQITSAEQSLERAKTAEWERNNRIKYAALEQEMNAANWYFDNYDYENFKELVASEKNSAAMQGMPDIYTVDVRDQYTKEEASIYMYLREKGRVEEADAYANYMQSTAAARRNQQIEQRLAEEDIGIVGRTIGAVAANPGKIANTIDINLQKLGNVLGDEYMPIDYETTGNFGVASNVNREIATKELAALGTLNDALGVEIPYIGSYTLGDLYGTGVDYLNSAMNVALFGTGAAGTALAAEKFSDEYRAAKERGGTDDQAFNYAWGSSIAEGVGEQIVLDRYLGFLTKLGRNPGKAAAIMAGIISVAEGGVQEAATTVMENAVDKWTMGENSEFNIAVRRYEAMGYEHGTAEQMAIDEMNREILKSGIMGALGQGAPVAGGYAAQGISKAAGSVQTAIDDSARGRQIQKMDNAQQMAQLMGEVTGETVTPEKSKRKLGKQQREFIENAGEYVSGADEATRDIVRGKVYDVANASAEALDGTSQAAKEKADKRSAAMKTSETGASVGGESVTVQGFVKTAGKGSDAKLNIKKADGTLAEANMEDVTFDSKTAEVYSYAADMATPELANTFRMSIQPEQMGSIERVANGYSQAYDMARAGFKEASVRASSLTGALTDEQVSAAYKLGAEARKSAQIAAITKAAERAKANMGNAWKGGKASFDDSVVVDALDDTQKAQIDVASVFTGSMGVNVVFFESKADETGRYTRENGSYNRKTNTIYIDVNAGRYYKGDSPSKTALLRTLSHEVTHAVQRNSPEIYSELRDTVTDILGDTKGVTIEDLIDRKMAADSSLTTRDAAMDELVADACERMIEDSDAAQRLAEAHPEAAKTIFQKVGELLKKIGDAIKAAFKGRQLSTEAQLVMKDVERYQKMVDLWTKGVMQTAEVSGREYATGAEDTVENTEAFLDSEEAIQNQARPPYTDKTKACTAFVESLNEEARATYDLLYNFYQASRLGRQNLSSKFMYYSDWNAMVAKDPRWAERAQAMADSIPAAVREKMRMNDDGTLNPNSLETEFKMNRSMGQRIIDALETEVIDTKYVIDGTEYRLSKGNATTAVGGEAYRRAVCEETRKAYRDGTLKQASIGTLSKDKWGSLGFLATNGKTGASGDFTTLCPQMFYNKGCHYCYRLAALTTGVNNKLVGANVWYGGEILRIKDADIDMLNRNGGLRIQSFGDWMPQFSSQLADMLYDADMRGLQIKIITKEPSMIEYVALLREQGLGKSLYFNLSADYAIERAGSRETADYTTMNTSRPYMRDAQGDLWWKRAMTVQEANKYRQKYPWVNTRIVATTQEEFLRGLRDSTVDVVTGYHGNIREWERIDSEDGKVVVNVEALGDAGMPRFAYDASTNEWSIEYEGKTATHKALAHAIADAGLQYEYYVKTCCITGRCATCEGKCGRLAKDFNIKNATNRDGESVAYWQQQMEYDEAGEQTMEYDDVQYSARVTDPNTLDFLDNQETVTTYKTMQVVNGKLYPPMAAVVAGSYEDASELGTWEQATEHPELIKLDKKGKPQFVLNKGQGKGNVPAAYNPYMHSSNIVLNDQFSSAYNRPNLVTVECEVPVSELTSGYRAQYAKDAVGWHSWHTGTVAGALRKATGMERQVLLSRWIKPVRIVPDAEVALMYKDLLDGTGVAVPDNVVPPGLLRELEKIGVPITKSGKVEDNTVQYSPRGTRDEAKRNRALREGDMLNEFHKAMSKYEWKQYFYRIGSDAAYNPDLYDDGDTTTVVVEDMLLLLEMQSNGEFSVIDLYKSEAIRYNRTEFEDMDFVETWRDAGYDAKKLIRWAAAADNDVGKTIFRRYDRVQLRFVNVDASYIKAGQEGTGTGIDDIHRRRTYGKGVLESDTAEDEVSAEVNQTRDPDQISIRELLVNAIEAEVTDSEENAWLKGYRADLGKMMEKQAELDKQREELDRLTRTARQRRQEAKQRSIEYGARSGLSKTELANLSRYENIIESLSQTAKRSEMQQAALDRAQANFEFLKDKTEGRLTDEAFEDWRRQKKLSEGDPEQLLSDSAKAGLQKARSRVATLSGQLARMDDGLLKLEASKPIMNIVEREREAVKKEADKRVERVRNRYATDAMRKKLSRKAASLDERLRHPKDGAYIPDELKQAAIELDQLIADMNVGYGSDPKKAAERRIDRVRRELAAMRELGTNISQVVDEDLITMLEELRKKAQDMLISEMSVEDLQDIEKAIDHVLFLSNSAYDLHIAGKNERIARAAVAQAADMEGKHTKKHKGVIALLQKLARDENLPIYFFRRLGGKFDELAQGLFDGESDFGIIAAEENALIERIKKKHNYDEWFKDGILELVPENGGRLKMNREEALMLYATHNREVTNKRQDARHLSKGGVVEKHTDPRIKDAENSSEGVKLSEGDMQTISDWLTAEQKAYADEVVAHLSGELADRLNEASRRMHGFSKFTEEYYFPYNVSGLSLPQNINEAQAKLMASVGMAKSTTAEAVKPVTMGEFTDMVTEHIRTALMYATMAPAQQDFMRLLNYQFEDEDSKTTMTEKLTDAYGEDVVKYMLTFMRDIYGRTTDKGSLDALAASMTSRFKKNAVALSASVWLQQYTSMYRAWAVIGPQYFYGKVHNPAKSWEQAKKYAGTAVMKEIGRFDTNVGRNVAEWIANKKAYTIPGRAVEISDAVTGWIPEKMDMLAWTRIWEACKREQAKALGKDTESEEVLKAAGRRMDEVTRLTQVYDSVFSKSAHMRNKGWVAKTFTNFMAESTVVVNMFVDAVLNAKKNPGQLVRTSVMLLGSTIAVNFMASFAYAWRDDDEDETYFEKYIQSVVSGFVDDLNPMNYLPVLNKIVSELKGFTGDSTEMATIADTIGYAKLALTMERGVSLEDRLLYAAHAIGAAMGIPVKNVYREVSGVIRAIKNVGNVKLREDAILNAVKYGALDGSLIATMLGISDSKEYNADQMYKAIRDGDYAEAADLRTHLINFNGAKDDKAVDSLLRTRIKDGFTAGEIGADEAIELLTGYAGMKQDDASEKVLEWQYAIDNDGSSYSDMRERYLEGEISYDDAVSDRVQYGGVESDKAKATVDKWEFERLNGYAYEDLREEHADGNVSSAEAMEIMQDYGGKDENEAYWEVAEWDYGDGWDGKGTLLNDAFASGSDTQVCSRMQELAGHSDWQKPGNELASYVTDFYKPIYEAAPEAQKDALRQTILEYLKMAYEAVGEEYYGDDYALRYRSWLKK